MIFEKIVSAAIKVDATKKRIEDTVRELKRQARRVKLAYQALKELLLKYQLALTALEKLIPRLSKLLQKAQGVPYAGAVISVIRKIIPAVERLVKKINDAVKDIRPVVNKIDRALDALDLLINLPDPNLSFVDDVLDLVIEIAIPLEEQQPVLEEILPKELQDKLAEYVKILEDVDKALNDKLKPLQAIIDFLRLHNDVIEGLTRLLSGQLDFLKIFDPVIEFFDPILEYLETLIKNFKDSLPDFLKGFVESIESLLEQLDGLINQALEKLGLNKFIDDLFAGFPGIEEIFANFRELIQTMLQFEKMVKEQIEKALADLVKALQDAIAKARELYLILRSIAAVKGLYEDDMEKRRKALKDLIEKIKKILERAGAGKPGEDLEDLFKKIQKEFKFLETNFYTTPVLPIDLKRMAEIEGSVKETKSVIGDLGRELKLLAKAPKSKSNLEKARLNVLEFSRQLNKMGRLSRELFAGQLKSDRGYWESFGIVLAKSPRLREDPLPAARRRAAGPADLGRERLNQLPRRFRKTARRLGIKSR
ncbi:MAG TPA: hypothetical protein VJR29_08945 [bacterium]|nr:hypothetical protein [bacterium]